MNSPLVAVIYARVSTNTQEHNYSFPFQLDACRDYAKQQGMVVVAEFQETASGGSLTRPELEKVRAMLRAGKANALVVYNTDRLSRSLGQLLYLKTEIQQSGASLHYATRGQNSTDAIGELFESIEGAFAEYEQQKIRDRLYTGRIRKITGTTDKPAQIYGNGNCPYGYRYEGFKKNRRIVVDETEAIVVKEMYKLCLEGLSMQAIANRLNELGIQTPGQRGRNGGTFKRLKPMWVPGTVYRILKNEVHTGVMYFNKSSWNGRKSIDNPPELWIAVPIPAIIEKEVFDAVAKRLPEGRKFKTSDTHKFYLLSGSRLKCQCGYTMTGSGSRSDHGGRYRCKWPNTAAHVPCTLGNLSCKVVDELVWSWLHNMLTAEHIRNGIDVNNSMNAREKATIDETIVQIDKRRSSLEKESERMIAAYKAEVITLDELKQDKAVIDAERKSLDHEYARLENLRRDASWQDADSLLAQAEELRSHMPLMNNEEKAALVDRLELKIVRRAAANGEQMLDLDCRLGRAMLPLK